MCQEKSCSPSTRFYSTKSQENNLLPCLCDAIDLLCPCVINYFGFNQSIVKSVLADFVG